MQPQVHGWEVVMFKVGDIVRRKGWPNGRLVIEGVATCKVGDPLSHSTYQIVRLTGGDDFWYDSNRYELNAPPKTYRVYQDVTADSADEARAKVGASFQVEERP